jgi:hypothetical protein
VAQRVKGSLILVMCYLLDIFDNNCKLYQKTVTMKRTKLKLETLKVQSFVTLIEGSNAETIKGGTGDTLNPACQTEVAACQNTVANVCPGDITHACGGTRNCPTLGCALESIAFPCYPQHP